MSLAVAFVITLVVLLISFGPVLAGRTRQGGDADLAGDLTEAIAERERLLASMKDLDMDLAMGKLSDEDHSQMRSGLEREAIAVLAKIESGRSAPGSTESRGPSGTAS